MKRLVTLVTLVTALSLAGFAQAAPAKSSLSQHATVKIGKKFLSGIAKAATVGRKSLGVAAFLAEPPLDALHLASYAADHATAVGSDPDAAAKAFRVIHDFFVGSDFIFAHADTYDEDVQKWASGSSN